MENENTDSPFGEVIFSYTREQAIEDGVLIDEPLAKLAQDAGIRYHCAMTVGLYSEINPGKAAQDAGQSLSGRIWDMLNVFLFTVRVSESTDSLWFEFLVSGRKVKVHAVCGPGDNAEPCITFLLPGED